MSNSKLGLEERLSLVRKYRKKPLFLRQIGEYEEEARILMYDYGRNMEREVIDVRERSREDCWID